jgi:hypothetical protein
VALDSEFFITLLLFFFRHHYTSFAIITRHHSSSFGDDDAVDERAAGGRRGGRDLAARLDQLFGAGGAGFGVVINGGDGLTGRDGVSDFFV